MPPQLRKRALAAAIKLFVLKPWLHIVIHGPLFVAVNSGPCNWGEGKRQGKASKARLRLADKDGRNRAQKDKKG